MSELAVQGPPDIPTWRKWAPFVVGAVLIGYVASRLDLAAFGRALGSTNYVGFLAFACVFNFALLAADAFATAAAYRRLIAPVGFGEVFILRGASYLPSLVNHHVGQAWLTYFLSKQYKAPLFRVAGATLIIYVTTFGVLYCLLLVGIALSGGLVPWLTTVALVIAALGFVYVTVVRLSPRFLASRQVTAPLLEVGVLGHLALCVYRVPHVVIQFFGAWLPFAFFGVDIPIGDALSILPLIMFAVALPVSPVGLGTRDALALSLLSGYAHGSPKEQAAVIAATTLSWVCAITLVQAITAPLFMRRAYKLGIGSSAAIPQP